MPIADLRFQISAVNGPAARARITERIASALRIETSPPDVTRVPTFAPEQPRPPGEVRGAADRLSNLRR